MNVVRELREHAGIQQKELALAIGVSQPTVSEWEHGKKDPSGERLEKLSVFFGVNERVIRGLEPIPGTVIPEPITEEDRELWELREAVRRDSERYYLLSFAKDANAQDVREVVAIIEAVRKVRRES